MTTKTTPAKPAKAAASKASSKAATTKDSVKAAATKVSTNPPATKTSTNVAATRVSAKTPPTKTSTKDASPKVAAVKVAALGAERGRCTWANPLNPLYLAYHDHEWGVPCHDENRLFEMLNLEGAQAGLSWETILNKRANYRAAFDGWDAKKIAAYDSAKVAALLADAGIVRNRLKVAAAISNAQAYLRLCDELGGLDAYLWAHVGGKPVVNHWTPGSPRPAKTELSDRISKDLLKRGFKFVGSTIIYAYMQGIGMVDDHDSGCFRRHARR